MTAQLAAPHLRGSAQRLHAYSGVFIPPNIQYIRDPGGVSKSTDVIILDLKLSVAL
jgi:carbohydrate-selective porin OprB